MAPLSPTPPEALRRAAARWRARAAESMPTEKAGGRFLAKAVELPPEERRAETPRAARAAIDGYALPRGAGAGEHEYRSARVDLPGASSSGEPARVVRVDSGDALPDGTERVVPVGWTSLAAGPQESPPRVRIAAGALPPAGYGIVREPDAALVIEAGSHVDGRLQSLLLARGVASVEAYAPKEVGILTIGRDLIDVQGQAGAGAGAGTEPDLTGYWLPAGVAAAGHRPRALGLSGEIEEARISLLRARQRKLRHVIICGGVGEGIEDRTAELILSMGGRVFLDRVDVELGLPFLVGHWIDVEILGLSGRPRAAACAFDLFVLPALLCALGAPSSVWDWSRRSRARSELGRIPAPPPAAAGLWSVVPVGRGGSGSEWAILDSARWASPFLPWMPDQGGWAVLPPLGLPTKGLPPDGTLPEGGEPALPVHPQPVYYFQAVQSAAGGQSGGLPP